MINQPEPVFSFTIPYISSQIGETDEIFVSEKTYEKYLQAMNKTNTLIIHGKLHPIADHFGEVTSTLFDHDKVTIILGTKDIEEYTNELLDIAIAQELEKTLLTEKETFFRFLYAENTPDNTQTFIDDIQQTLEEIHIAKRLMKDGYRIYEREALLAQEILTHSIQFKELKNISPFENEHGIFLLTKLIFLKYVDGNLFQQYKRTLHSIYPRLFLEVNKLLQLLRKVNLSQVNGREQALNKIFQRLQYTKYVTKITINDIKEFQLGTSPMNQDKTVTNDTSYN